MTTAVIEFTPESILDIAAANIAATTSPDTPGGRWKAMKYGKTLSALPFKDMSPGSSSGCALKYPNKANPTHPSVNATITETLNCVASAHRAAEASFVAMNL